MTRKIVIIGGVGGGATVAAQLRREDAESEIIVLDKGSHIAFSNCGMPYHIGGLVKNRDDILYSTEQFRKKYKVTVHTNTEVKAINRSTQRIYYQAALDAGELGFDKLILAPGASAIIPNIEGLNPQRTFPLHTISDMDNISDFIETKKPQSVAIVGAGFVGLEMVENLRERGLKCTIIDRSSQAIKIIDEDLAAIVENHLNDKGVQILLDDGLASCSNDGKTLHLNSGRKVEADLIIMAVGIKPNTELAIDADLKIGTTGAIAVNEYMQTSDPNIYALGDVVEAPDTVTGTPRHVALAWPAHRQAYIIARHLTGATASFNGTQGSAILKVFDLTVGATGLNSHKLKELGMDFQTASLETMSNASYYPGAEKLWIKVLFDEAHGRIYGAQAVGYAGVDKRLAVLATALKAGLTVADLPELELAYAPPYSSPKDPINILGYKAAAMLKSL
ncbi:CoA-disulfide reductase [Virgibacillus halodenitrificans]|uniref:CoA-disulfide reductase n=2 Tax=Virgibacillus halodenitrificans TaxID=1482 RepID=UPI000EF46267|nr:CoA-disulfide reductase [Virgibacillus halodenitrificans]